MDTYSNLLHKVGKTKEAIEWQEKAIAAVDEASKAEYQATLEKMKKGEPTWQGGYSLIQTLDNRHKTLDNCMIDNKGQ